MKITSKFLTAEVRLTRVQLTRDGLVVEGTVKELMPISVAITRADLKLTARLLFDDVRARVRKRPAASAEREAVGVAVPRRSAAA